jgi:hypothetical protein
MDEGDIIGSVMHQRHIENDLKFEGKSVRDLISTHELDSFVSNFLTEKIKDSEKIIRLDELAKFLYENGFFFKAIKITELELSLIKDNPQVQNHCFLRIANSHRMVGNEKEAMLFYEKHDKNEQKE